MKRKLLIICTGFIFLSARLFAQANVFNPADPINNYNNTPLPPDGAIYKWVRTPRPEVNFNTTNFKCYYYNGMAFRLRFPNGYNPADPTKKYPVILFFHGGGEASPNTDNEFHLLHGAAYFENRINAGLFDAFLLFPESEVIGWENYMGRINNVVDSLQKYCNLDPDRLISMGLSIGANAAISYGIQFPKRTAVAISSSPALIDGLSQDVAGYIHMPLWIASGGQDINPSPTSTQRYVDNFASNGGDIRYSFYPELGHNVWDRMWHEPYLFPYWNAAHKANPLVYYKQTQFSGNTPVNARIGITPGFHQYEWQMGTNGTTWSLIQGAVSNDIIATQAGYYRVRFKRTANSLWSDWSPNPAVITGGLTDTIPPSVPVNLQVVSVSGSSVSLNWDNSTDNIGVTKYDVYVNAVKKYTTTTSDIVADSLLPNTSYNFTIKALDQAGNASAFSSAITGTTSNSSTTNGLSYKYYEGTWTLLPDFNTLTPAKTGISANVDIGVRTTGRNDNFAFLWQGYINIPTPGDYTFETVSDDGSKLYFNTAYSSNANALVNNDGLHAAGPVSGTVNIPAAGAYQIAISYFEANNGETMQVYWTGPGISRQLIPSSAFTVSSPTPSDTVPPSVPASLIVVSTSTNSINLDWDNATDNVGVTGYDVYLGGVKKYSTTVSEVIADNLAPNTAYTFTVKARDFANNSSAFSSPVTGTTKSTPTSGLSYKYYEGAWSVLPNFNTLTPVKTGNTPNVDISVKPAGITDNFAFLWEGFINITTPGNYIFETVSDDGSKLYFNTTYSPAAVALVNNDGLHASRSVTGAVNIPSAGVYPIAISFFEGGGGESMQVFWSGPGLTRQQIPSSAFIAPPPPDTTAPSVPANLSALYSGRTFVHLDWSNSTDSSGIAGYDVFLNGTKRYSTTTSAITADSLTAGTSYNFTVKARDNAGNVSAFSSPVSVTTPASTSGLYYRYYEGSWTLLPSFNSLTPIKSGNSANVDLAIKNRSDSFGIVWEGYINIPTPGTYTFETVSDEGSKLYFNSFYSATANALVNNDGIHTPTSATGTVNVATAGLYPIAMTFFEKSGLESMQVFWTGPGFARQLIPNNAFTPTFQVPPDTIPPSVPTNLRALSTSRNSVSLDWNDSVDSIGVTGYEIYVNGVKKYASTISAVTADSLVAGTSYTFTVKARDYSGNLSAFSAPLTVATSNGGLTYRFYQGTWSALPNFNTLTPVKTGNSANVDISVRTPGVNDNFAFLWEGYINIPTPGNYTFETSSDDGSKLYFNTLYSPSATALVDNDGLHGPRPIAGTVNIASAGLYPISITYFEQGYGEIMEVYWTGPGISRQLIPNSAFTESAPPPVPDTIAPGVPANLVVVSTTSTSVNLNWNDATDNVGVTGYDIYVDGVKRYTSVLSEVVADNLVANTSYSFTVKSRDQAGNTSAFSSAVAGRTSNVTSGLNYKYYHGSWSVLPNFSSLTPIKTGITPNVDISVRNAGVNDNFGFLWEGYINITTPGSYTFETVSDDGSKLYFNTPYSSSATALVNNDGLHGARPVAGTVNIAAAGVYPIAITFFEAGSGETMQVYWTGPGIARQLIPNTAFTVTSPAQTDSIAPSVPANLVVLSTSGNSVNLDWNNSTDNVGVVGYDVYVDGVKKYSTTVSDVVADNLLPNTTYSFTVKARDQAGNTSGFSAAVSGRTTNVVSGLNYKYYEGSWSALPNFSTLTPVRTGNSPNVDINVRPAGVFDNFGFLWEGYINIPTPGVYTFETISDDGSKLYFNSAYSFGATALVNNDGLHASRSVTGSVNVASAGVYPIAITFFEGGGGETMQVYWSGPGLARQLIPNSAFTATSGSSTSLTTSALINQIGVQGNVAGAGSEEKVIAIPEVYPNPFTESFNIRFNNTSAVAIISVDINDLTGRVLHNQYFGKMPVGKTMLKVDLANKQLVRGTYLVSLRMNGRIVRTVKLIKRMK